MAVFSQFWYWYPLIYFISLSFAPTAFIGLNEELRMPKFDFVSETKPSMFGYPPSVAPPTTTSAVKLPTAVLSTSNRAKVRGAKKEAEVKAVKVSVPEGVASASSTIAEVSSASAEGASDGDKESTSAVKDENAMDVEGGVEKKSAVAEPSFEVLSNPARVVPAQEKFIKFREDSRYAPLKLKRAPSGFVMLRDMTPSEPVELVSTDTPVSGAAAAAPAANPTTAAMEDNEPPPPEAFEYVP
jgi:26S proteasome regulatory subunit N2